mmetsp:Transcript_4752/g.7079  ORF Transcript_4752/g.7079 Transcript_4752/m.7079 type:complete len:215 (-) Transcript_4752:799-1443(-)
MRQILDHLESLSYPFEIDFNVRGDLVKLIWWLENQKIRCLSFEDREPLRSDSEVWDANVLNYLKQLGCPFTWKDCNNFDCIYWLVAYSVSVELEDLEEDNDDIIDDNGPINEFISECSERLHLKILPHESFGDYLERLYETISGQLHSSQLDLSDFPLGFDSNDKLVNQISLVYKFLHLSGFREMQNDVNSIIELAQAYTANPKLNTSLGKVGR